MIETTGAVIATLCAICAFYFWLERATKQTFLGTVFQYFPPLLWIYATPVLLNNTGVLPPKSEAYDLLKSAALPSFLVLMLLSVDLRAALRVMGRGIAVMLVGSLGVVIGGALAFALVHHGLSDDSWKVFGGLAGAWIGGTGNMAAVAGGLEGPEVDLGLAILADNVIYVVWLPLLLSSRAFAGRFNRWAKVDPERMARMTEASLGDEGQSQPLQMVHVIYLAAVVAGLSWASSALAELMPELPPVLSTGTWRTLWLTTLALGASFTPLRHIPGSRSMGLALVYLFLAGMGARASISGLSEAPLFLAGAFLWITIHGLACVGAAKLLRVDLHTAAIASAANIGGAASAPVVAAHHQPALVPVSILMALVGYAAGNYLAVLTAQLCFWISGL
ncbi:MAG: DUF819 domain-containing protein [Bradymonadia bacterium]